MTSPGTPDLEFFWAPLVLLLATVGTSGVILGWYLHKSWVWIRGRISQSLVRQAGAWETLVTRAVRFVRRRRAIGLAFSALGNYSLRPSEGSQPTSARRRRLATPGPRARSQREVQELTPLREGPVINHGSNRGRAQHDGITGRRSDILEAWHQPGQCWSCCTVYTLSDARIPDSTGNSSSISHKEAEAEQCD